MMKSKLLAIATLALLLGACGSQDIPDPEPETTTVGSDDEFGSSTDDYGEETFGSGEEVPFEPQEEELAMIIYFAFDQSDISAEDQATLARHANNLANDSLESIRLEGHADERGSREYNIGLGERRSQAVRKLLLIQGASTSQISTVSFGEERPAAFGGDEAAFSQNRRVEIKYTN